jgi:hypothetical protein
MIDKWLTFNIKQSSEKELVLLSMAHLVGADGMD